MRARSSAQSGARSPRDEHDLVDFAEITEIELRVLRRMKEYTLGDHGSVFHGTGVDFVGLRDWQAGDRLSSIDWPQSTLTNFTPMVIREYEQPGTAPDRRRRRSLAVHALRHQTGRRLPPGLRERWPPSACRRCISRIMFGHHRVRPGTFRRMSAVPSARRPWPRDPLPGRVSGTRRHGGRQEPASGWPRPSAGIFAGPPCCR